MNNDARLERGRLLSQDKRIKRIAGSKWMVPSQTASTGAAYIVDEDEATCTCPDYEERRAKCKHVYAVEFFRVVTTYDIRGCVLAGQAAV